MTVNATGKILVAVDGSHLARNAAEMAIRLAEIQGYGIHALYVVDEALALETYSDYHRELTFKVDPDEDDDPVALLEAQGALALDQVELKAKLADVPVEAEMLLGNVEDLILERAEQALMIAMGRRGNRHAGQPHHLGAHFWQVVHKAKVPIIAAGDVLPERASRLMFVFTGDDERSMKALHGVTILQRDLNADVLVVLAGDPTDVQAQDWQDQVLARIAEEDRPHYRFVRRAEKRAEALVAVAEEENVDLIVMSYVHRHLAILDEILGTPLDKVLQETQIPVIIVR